MQSKPEEQAKPLSPLMGLGVLLAVVIIVAAFVMLGSLLKISALYSSFVFILYWMAIKHSDLNEFWPALLGGAGGIGLAWLLHSLPHQFGTIGIACAAILVLAAIYVQIMNWAPLVVNVSFMLFLTVSSIPALHTPEILRDMLLALVYAGAFVGGLVFAATRIARARKQTAGETAAG